MSGAFDRRITPARSDLAAAHLKGAVAADRFVEGRSAQAARGVVPLRVSPSDDGAQDSQLLFGEEFTIYEEKDGWVWGQAALDKYVGYARANGFGAIAALPTHRVGALGTPLLGGPDAKSAAHDMLPMNAKLAVAQTQGRFVRLDNGFYVFAGHCVSLKTHAPDWVTVAERFLGVPYLWGGKTYAGLDCSGLVQTALEAGGISAPRDTDMMEAALGQAITPEAGAPETDLRRGDLIFWKGHVGIMVDGERLLHANGFAMQVTLESLTAVRARTLTSENLAVRSAKRL